MDGNRLTIGYVAGAHGIRGGLRVQLHDTDSEALRDGMSIWLVPPERSNKPPQSVRIVDLEFVPGKAGRVRLNLEGLTDRDAAEALKGFSIEVEREALPPLADDEFYLVDAVGLAVERERDGTVESLGVVTGLGTNGAQDLFEIEWKDERGKPHPWLLPVVPHFIRDIDDRRVLVEVPLGLLPEALEPLDGEV